MYLLGRHQGKAAVFKLDKETASVKWRLEIKLAGTDPLASPDSKMTDVLAYVQPEGQRYLYVCGYAFEDATADSTEKRAVMFKVSDSGAV
jgi:hypothetical protein